jgi:hypothetical protein
MNVFNSSKYKKRINSYNLNSVDKCIANKHIKRHITNPKYSLFDHTEFHAGDNYDFEKYGLVLTRYSNTKRKINIKNNTYKKKIIMSPLYKQITLISIKNTFKYIFNKFKKGVYIIIRDNKLAIFLPFSNARYINTFYQYLVLPNEEPSLMMDIYKLTVKRNKSDIDKNKLRELEQLARNNVIQFQRDNKHMLGHQKLLLDRKKWVANNCMFRNTFPVYEGDQSVNIYKNMMDTLIRVRDIPDCEFFISVRDFPILNNDLTEPYNHLYNSTKIKIEKEYQFKKFAPILTNATSKKLATIPIITSDDWRRVSDRIYPNKCSTDYIDENINTDWNKKKDIAIFRGSATGCGITIETNQRLMAAYLSTQNYKLLDVGITNWNPRLKKYTDKPLGFINKRSLSNKQDNISLDDGTFINNYDKSCHKYILNIDGHVSAFRLSFELSMNSVILLVESEYEMWYSSLLKQNIHYIPIKKDLSDLIDKIKWCKKNDTKCKKIAQNALHLYNTCLQKDNMLDYMQQVLLKINKSRHSNFINIKKSKIKTAIITIYRDNGSGNREKQKEIFLKTMSKLLEPYGTYHIYVIEQSDDGNKFNIGKLKNIGFDIASKQKYDNYVFTDIDMIPDSDLIEYYFKKCKYPVHLAHKGTRYNSKNTNIFFGAVNMFSKTQFQNINGYPNNFWGWGGEDDELLLRINDCKMNINIPSIGSVIDIEETNNREVTIKNKLVNLNKESSKYEKLAVHANTWNKNGINKLNYNIISTVNDNVITHCIVDLQKSIDEKQYPELYNINITYNNSKSILQQLKLNRNIKFIKL